MESVTIIAAPSSGYALVALFADAETTAQASDLKTVTVPVVAFSIDSVGIVRPIPVRQIDALDETDAEFRMVALQAPDGGLTPLTRAWEHGYGPLAEQATQRTKTLDSLPSFKAFAFGKFQSQRSSMTNYVASVRQRATEKAGYAQRVADVQEALRQDNAAKLIKRLEEIQEAQQRDAARAAATAASIAEAAQRG